MRIYRIGVYLIPEKLIDTVAHCADEVVALANNEVDNTWQNQFAEFDTESTDRQEAFQVGVGEALGDSAGDFDDPFDISLIILDSPECAVRIHDNTKSSGVYRERHLCNEITRGERSDVVDFERCALKDVGQAL